MGRRDPMATPASPRAVIGSFSPARPRLENDRETTPEQHGSDNSCRYVRIRTMQIL
jgi:hypothetical protein